MFYVHADSASFLGAGPSPTIKTEDSASVQEPGLPEPVRYVPCRSRELLAASPLPTIKTEVRPRSSAAGQIPSVLRVPAAVCARARCA
jgi:hypothetical protein